MMFWSIELILIIMSYILHKNSDIHLVVWWLVFNCIYYGFEYFGGKDD